MIFPPYVFVPQSPSPPPSMSVSHGEEAWNWEKINGAGKNRRQNLINKISIYDDDCDIAVGGLCGCDDDGVYKKAVISRQ